MGELQKVFDTCRQLYKDCFVTMDAMAKLVSQTMAKKNVQYDPRTFTGAYDILLQYSLLQVAVSDSSFDRNEVIFIRDLTVQGDFVNYMNAVTKTSVTWDTLYHENADQLKSVLRQIEPLFVMLSNEFIELYALTDAATPNKDYVAELEQKTAAIICGLAAIDGHISESELEFNPLIMNVIFKIEQRKKEYERQMK